MQTEENNNEVTDILTQEEIKQLFKVAEGEQRRKKDK